MSKGLWLLVACFLSMVHAQVVVSRFSAPASSRSGERARFEVEASGKGDLLYTWYFDGVQQNETSAIWETQSLTLADNGKEVLCFVSQVGSALESVPLVAHLKVYAPSSRTLLLQGVLTDRVGSKNIEVDMRVLLYNTPVGGESIYQESFLATDGNSVQVNEGQFAVRLGSTDVDLPTILQNTNDVYAEFQIGVGGSFETLTPRLAVTAHPFALTAHQLRPVSQGQEP